MNGRKKSKEQAKKLDRFKDTSIKIGARIRELRIEKGFKSQEKFANEFGIDRAQFGRIERGATTTIKTLLKILDALDTTLEDFFKGFP